MTIYTTNSSATTGDLVQQKKVTLLDRVLQKRNDLGFSTADLTNRKINVIDADTIDIQASPEDLAYDPTASHVRLRFNTTNPGESYNPYEVSHEKFDDATRARLDKQKKALDEESPILSFFNPSTDEDVFKRGEQGKQALIEALKPVTEGKTNLDLALQGQDKYNRELADVRLTGSNESLVSQLNTPEINSAYNSPYNFVKANQDNPSLSQDTQDIGRGLLSGFEGIGSALGYGLEKSGIAPTLGREMQDEHQRHDELLRSHLSLATQRAMTQPLINEDNTINPQFGMRALLTNVIPSIPGSLAMGVGGMPIAKGVTAGLDALTGITAGRLAQVTGKELAKDLSKKLAINNAAGNMIGFGTSEGVFSAAQNASQTGEDLRAKPISEFEKSPIWKETLAKNNGNREATKEEIINKAQSDIFNTTALTTGALSGITGGGMYGALKGAIESTGKIGLKEAIKNTLKGAGHEALQETPQSYYEQIAQNQAIKDYLDPTQDVNEGAINAAVVGGLSGAVMGMGLGGGHIQTLKDALQSTKTPIDTQTSTEDTNQAVESNIEAPRAIVDRYADVANKTTEADAVANFDKGVEEFPHDLPLADKVEVMKHLETIVGKAPEDASSKYEEEYSNLIGKITAEQTLQAVFKANPIQDVLANNSIDTLDALVNKVTSTTKKGDTIYSDIGRTKDEDTLNILKQFSIAKADDYANSESINDPYILATTGIETSKLESNATKEFSSLMRDEVSDPNYSLKYLADNLSKPIDKPTAISALIKSITKAYTKDFDITPATEKVVKKALNTIGSLTDKSNKPIIINANDSLEEIYNKILPTFGSQYIEDNSGKLSKETIKTNNELAEALQEHVDTYLKGKTTEQVANDKLVGGGKLPSYKEHIGLIQLALANNIRQEFVKSRIDRLAKWVAYDKGRAELFTKLAYAQTNEERTKYSKALEAYQVKNDFTDNESLKFTDVKGTRNLSAKINSESKIMVDALKNITNEYNTKFNISKGLIPKAKAKIKPAAIQSINQRNSQFGGITQITPTDDIPPDIDNGGAYFDDTEVSQEDYEVYLNSTSQTDEDALHSTNEDLVDTWDISQEQEENYDSILNMVDTYQKGNYETSLGKALRQAIKDINDDVKTFNSNLPEGRKKLNLISGENKIKQLPIKIAELRTLAKPKSTFKNPKFTKSKVKTNSNVIKSEDDLIQAQKDYEAEQDYQNQQESLTINESTESEEVITSEDKTTVTASTEPTEVFLDLLNAGNISNILDYISTNSSALSGIAKHIKQFIPKDVRLIVTESDDENTKGFYSNSSKVIYIHPNNKAFDNKNKLSLLMRTTLHEMIHVVTQDKIDSNPKIQEHLRRLITLLQKEAINDILSKEIKGKTYTFNLKNMSNGAGIIDIHELLTYGLMDYHLSKILDTIAYDSNKSLLDRFIDLITNLLGLPNQVSNKTLLTELIKTYGSIVENIEEEFTPPTKQEFTPEYQKEIKYFKLINIAKLKKDLLILKPTKHSIQNPISQMFTFDKTKESLFGKYPKLFENLFNLPEFTVKTNDGLKAFETLKKEESKFQEVFKKSFLEKPYEDDPISVLSNRNVSNGKFDSNIVSAMFIGSVDWLMNKGSDTLFNYEKDIQSILSMDENTIPQNEISNVISELGSVRAMIATGLGNNIFNLLKFTSSKTYPENEIAKLKLSLGLHALNTLNNMGYVTYSAIENSTFDRFKQNEVINPKVKRELTLKEMREEGSVVFVRIASEIENDKSVIKGDLKEVLNTLKAGSKEITSMFESAYEKELPRTKKPNRDSVLASLGFNEEKGKKATGLHTTQEITPERIDALTEYVQIPHTLDTPTMKLLLAMDENSMAEMELGVDFQEQKQQSKERSYRGKVLSYEKEKEALEKLLELSEQGSKPLYFMSTFWNQGRIGGIGVGHPQNNKWIRNLSSPKNYFVKIKPSDEFAIEQFKLAVLEAFGIAAKSLTKEQIDPKFQEILKDNEEAIEQINLQKEGKSFNSRKIINAVHKGKEKVHTLNGLVALSMYSATEEFETNIGREVDGITNGVLIGLVLLAGVDNFERMKDVLAAAGLYEDPTMDYATWKNTIKEKDLTNEDNYEQIARVFTEALDREDQTDQLKAIKHFIGELKDSKGKITKTGRNFAKPILLLTMFGKSTDKLANSVGDTVIATFYDELEKLYRDTDLQSKEKEAKLEVIKTQIQTIIGKTKLLGNQYEKGKTIKEDNKSKLVELTTKNLLEFSLTQQDTNTIINIVNRLFKEAIQYAINYNFGTTIDNRKILNDAYFVVGEVFKLGLQKKLDNFFIPQYEAKYGKLPTPQQLKLFRANEGKEPSAEQMDNLIAELIKIQPRSPTKNSESLEQDLQLWNSERSSNHTAAYRTQTGWNSKTGKLTYTVTDENGRVFTQELDLPKSTTAHALSLIVNSLGVGVTIANIHNRDSNVMIDMMKSKFKGLAVHDAYIFNLLEAVEGSKLLNSSLIDSLNSFDVFQGAVDNLERVQEYLKANPDIVNEINSAFQNPKVGIFSRQRFYEGSRNDEVVDPHFQNISEFIDRLKVNTKYLAIQRQKQLWNHIPIGGVKQYGGQDSIGSSEILNSVDPRLNIKPEEYALGNEPIAIIQDLNFTSMDEITDYSGGNIGADTNWDTIGREFGVTKFTHFREESNKNLNKTLMDLKVEPEILSEEDLANAREKIKELLPSIDLKNTKEDNKKAIAFYQVDSVNSIFTIAKLSSTYKGVYGNTSLAVKLAIKMNKPVYVWDVNIQKWFTWEAGKFRKVGTGTPILTRDFAGIGTIDTESYTGNFIGKDKQRAALYAIRDVYQKTMDSLKEESKPSTTQTNEDNNLGSIPNAQDIINDTPTLKKDITKDNIVSEFDSMEKDKDTTHSTFLRNFVSQIIAPVIEKTELYLFNKATYTYGQYSAELNRVAINFGKAMYEALSPFKMSQQEVFVHEFSHAVTWAAYTQDKNASLRRKIDEQYYKIRTEFLKARDKDSSLSKWDYVFDNKDFINIDNKPTSQGEVTTKSYDRGIQEYIAFGVSNKAFRELLKQLQPKRLKLTEVPDSSVSGNIREASYIEVITNLFKRILDSFTLLAKGKDALDSLTVFDNNVRFLLNANLNKPVPYITSVVDKGEAKVTKYVHEGFKGTLKFVAKGRGSKIDFIDSMANFADAIPKIGGFQTNQVLRNTIKLIPNKIVRNGLLDTMKDIIDITPKSKALANTIIQQKTAEGNRNDANDADEKALSDKLGILTDIQDHGLKNVVLRGDFVSLTDLYSLPEAISFLDKTTRDKAIKEIENKIPTLKKEALNLASIMVNGKNLFHGMTNHNAALIAKGNSSQPIDMYQDKIDLVTKLSRLYAIGLQDSNQVNEIGKLYKAKPKAFEEFLNFHKQVKKDKLSDNNILTLVDGDVHTDNDPNKTIFLGTKEDEAYMVKDLNAKVIGKLDRDPNDILSTEGILYLVNVKMLPDWDAKAMATVNSNIGSTDWKSGIVPTGRFKEATNREQAQLKADGTKVVNTIFTKNNSNVSRVAIHNTLGKIVGYEYILDRATQEKYLNSRVNVYRDIATDKNAIPYRAEAYRLNRKLVDQLYKYYIDYGVKAKKDMIRVGSDSTDKDLRDLWNMIPTETKKYIEQVFDDGKGFTIAEEELRNVFGYRKQTITNWIQPVQEDQLKRTHGNMIYEQAKRFGLNLANIKALETMWIELISIAKDTIVVKSGVVSAANESSNFMTAKLAGVPVGFYYKNKISAMKAEQQYRRDTHALLTHLSNSYGNPDYVTPEIDNEIKRLKSAISLNEMAYLHDEGLASTVAEEESHKDKHQIILYSRTEKARNLFDKLPKGVKDTLKVATMAEGTKIYKLLDEIAQMGDITSRHVLVKWEEQKAKTNGTEFNKDKAIDLAKFLFIQYHTTTNDMVQYGNDIGLLMFSKFATKAIKVLTYMVGEHPARLLALGLFEEFIATTEWIHHTSINKLANPITSALATINASPLINLFLIPPAYMPQAALGALSTLPLVP